MTPPARLAIIAGAAAVAGLGYLASLVTAPVLIDRLEAATQLTLRGSKVGDVSVRFVNGLGMLTRHPSLVGGTDLPDDQRTEIARRVARVSGVGGVAWADGDARAAGGERVYEPLHCQEDVEGLLRTRSIRFQQASSSLLPASEILLDEVASALRPCAGAIIAIIGHTDESGEENANIALSMDRARTVREALIARGIPRAGLRARGLGSAQPIEQLDPADPANRRIDFSVIRTTPLDPTPIDTPGAN